MKAAMRTLGLLLIVLLFIWATPAAAQNQRSSLPNLEIVILLDDSGSMYGATDRDDWRADAIELMVNALGVDQSAANFRVAIVSFHTEAATLSSGFTDLDDDAARQTLLATLRDENVRYDVGGWTDVLAALQAADGLFAGHNEAYKPIILLLTDGQPEKKDATRTGTNADPQALAVYTTEVLRYATTQFQPLTYGGATGCGITAGAPIYTIAIRNAASVPAYHQADIDLWQSISSQTGGGYYAILPANDEQFEKELQTTFTALMREMLCAQMTESGYLPISPTETTARTFPVDSIHGSVNFSISKTNPAVAVAIYNAAGQLVGATGQDIQVYENQHTQANEGHSEAWGFRRPDDLSGWAGEWRVELQGSDASSSIVEALITSLYGSDVVSVDIVQPEGSFLPVGSKAIIELHLSGENDALTIADLAELRILCGDQEFRPADVTVVGQTAYATIDFGSAQPGQCRLDVVADVQTADGARFPIPREKDLSAVAYPWADILSPRPGRYAAGALPELAVRLMVAQGEYAGVGADRVTAALYDAGDVLVASYELQPDLDQGQSTYVATLDPALPPGDYRLRVALEAQPPGSLDLLSPYYNDVRFSIDAAEPTPAPTATPLSVPTADEVLAQAVAATPAPPPATGAGPNSAWLLGGCLTGLLLLAAVLLYVLTRGRGRRTADLFDERGMSNDTQLNGSRLGQSVTIRDGNNDPLARLRVTVMADGRHQFKVDKLPEGVEVRHGDVTYTQGESFVPQHNDHIYVGSDVKLLYSNHAEIERIEAYQAGETPETGDVGQGLL